MELVETLLDVATNLTNARIKDFAIWD